MNFTRLTSKILFGQQHRFFSQESKSIPQKSFWTWVPLGNTIVSVGFLTAIFYNQKQMMNSMDKTLEEMKGKIPK